MTVHELKHQRDLINTKILTYMKQDAVLLKSLADNMAECATNIQGQGYANFVNARETFLSEVDRIQKDYSFYICSFGDDVRS